MTEQPRIEIRVPTEALRKLLQEDPAIFARLDAMAYEKIAEEVVRKATQKAMNVEVSVKGIVEKEFKVAEQELRSQLQRNYALQPAVAVAISSACDKAVEQHWNKKRSELERVMQERQEIILKNAEHEMNNRMTKAMNNFIEGMRFQIKAQAREEFMAVIENVKAKV